MKKYTAASAFDANGIQGKPGQVLSQEDVDFIGVSILEHLVNAKVILVSEEDDAPPAPTPSPIEHEAIVDEAGESDLLKEEDVPLDLPPAVSEAPKKKGKGKKK